MEFRLHVSNCPYSQLVAKSAIWEYSTMDVYRARFLGNGALRKKWQGSYRVITNDNIPTTLELDCNGGWTVHAEHGSSKGTWACEFRRGRSKSIHHSYLYDRDLASCNITFNYGITMQSQYRCIFQHQGVIILALSKGDSIPEGNIEKYSRCIFLVKEQEGEERPQTLEQFTSYVRDAYLHHLEDEEAITNSSLPPNSIIRFATALIGTFITLPIIGLALDIILILPMHLLSASSPFAVAIIYSLLSCVPIEWWVAKSDDIKRYILNNYIRKHRKQYTESEIAQTPSLQLFDNGWQGK